MGCYVAPITPVDGCASVAGLFNIACQAWWGRAATATATASSNEWTTLDWLSLALHLIGFVSILAAFVLPQFLIEDYDFDTLMIHTQSAFRGTTSISSGGGSSIALKEQMQLISAALPDEFTSSVVAPSSSSSVRSSRFLLIHSAHMLYAFSSAMLLFLMSMFHTSKIVLLMQLFHCFVTSMLFAVLVFKYPATQMENLSGSLWTHCVFAIVLLLWPSLPSAVFLVDLWSLFVDTLTLLGWLTLWQRNDDDIVEPLRASPKLLRDRDIAWKGFIAQLIHTVGVTALTIFVRTYLSVGSTVRLLAHLCIILSMAASHFQFIYRFLPDYSKAVSKDMAVNGAIPDGLTVKLNLRSLLICISVVMVSMVLVPRYLQYPCSTDDCYYCDNTSNNVVGSLMSDPVMMKDGLNVLSEFYQNGNNAASLTDDGNSQAQYEREISEEFEECGSTDGDDEEDDDDDDVGRKEQTSSSKVASVMTNLGESDSIPLSVLCSDPNIAQYLDCSAFMESYQQNSTDVGDFEENNEDVTYQYYSGLLGIEAEMTIDSPPSFLKRFLLWLIWLLDYLGIFKVINFIIGTLTLLLITSPMSYFASQVYKERQSQPKRKKKEQSAKENGYKHSLEATIVTADDVKLRTVLRDQYVKLYQKMAVMCQELGIFIPVTAEVNVEDLTVSLNQIHCANLILAQTLVQYHRSEQGIEVKAGKSKYSWVSQLILKVLGR